MKWKLDEIRFWIGLEHSSENEPIIELLNLDRMLLVCGNLW